jgi:Arc/MetJ-type ribon-helix-helix transcriptional regulator
VKLSVSLPAEDVALLDAFAVKSGMSSRSSALQHAIRLLRHATLDSDYANAWNERDASGEGTAWEGVAGDGLIDAPR